MADPIKVPILRSDRYTLLDQADSDLATRKWWLSPQGYAIGYEKIGFRKYKNPYPHRLILARKLGRKLKRGEQVDHINHNKLDNRRENIRPATSRQNTLNRSRQSNNTSGYIGVSYNKRPGRRKRWEAYIKANGKRRFLGFYATPEEAAVVRDKVALEYFGEFAHLNFPRGEMHDA